AVWPTHDGVAGADARGEVVHTGERRQNVLLERHGDGEAGEWDALDEREQVVDLRSFKRQKDGVDALAAEGGIEHEGRERMHDGMAGDAIDARGGVDLVEAIERA